jgi:BASS family bile acid:Na+ symporter
MIKITDYLSRRLPLLIVIVGITTYFSPFYLKVPPIIPSSLLGIVILFTGLSMNVDSIKEITTKKRELFIVALLKWTVTVFISIGLAYSFFFTKPEVAAGLILAGAVPSATAAAVYTFLAGGNTSLVIASSLLDVMISPFITPLSLIGFSSDQISISFLSLLKSFLFIVIIPLSAGQVNSFQIRNWSRGLVQVFRYYLLYISLLVVEKRQFHGKLVYCLLLDWQHSFKSSYRWFSPISFAIS